jgi:hypothetical protein
MSTGKVDRAPARPVREPVQLSELVEGWVADGLISPEQGAALRASGERVVVHPVGRARSVLVEAFAYLGGAVVVTGALLLASLFWSDLGDGARFLILAVAATTLGAAGAFVPATHGTPAGRLRSVLWLSAAGTAVPAFAVAAEWMGLGESETAVLMTWGSAALAALLWYRWRTVLQQSATMLLAASGGAALVSSFDVPDETIGLGVWTVGVVWALLAWCGLIRPWWLGRTAGSALAVIGAMMTAASDPGVVFTLATLAVLLGVAVLLRDPLMLGVGALGVVLNLPAAANRWFPGSVGVPLGLLVVGIVVVLVAVVMARRGTGEAVQREPLVGSPMLALTTACVVVAGVAAIVANLART